MFATKNMSIQCDGNICNAELDRYEWEHDIHSCSYRCEERCKEDSEIKCSKCSNKCCKNHIRLCGNCIIVILHNMIMIVMKGIWVVTVMI